MTKDMRINVELGAALLDEVYSNWVGAINTDSLEVSDSDCCVLAQLYGSYYQGNRILNERLSDHEECFDMADFGFDLYTGKDSDWSILQDAWKEQIAQRLGKRYFGNKHHDRFQAVS